VLLAIHVRLSFVRFSLGEAGDNINRAVAVRITATVARAIDFLDDILN
jgi:hypothetical protein